MMTEDQKIAEWLTSLDFRWSQGGYWINDEHGAISPDQAAFFYKATHPKPVIDNSDLERQANKMISTLLERHDVLAKGWHEPVYGKKIHIGDNCQTCGTHFNGLHEDIKHLFEFYAGEYVVADRKRILDRVEKAKPKLDVIISKDYNDGFAAAVMEIMKVLDQIREEEL